MNPQNASDREIVKLLAEKKRRPEIAALLNQKGLKTPSGLKWKVSNVSNRVGLLQGKDYKKKRTYRRRVPRPLTVQNVEIQSVTSPSKCFVVFGSPEALAAFARSYS